MKMRMSGWMAVLLSVTLVGCVAELTPGSGVGNNGLGGNVEGVGGQGSDASADTGNVLEDGSGSPSGDDDVSSGGDDASDEDAGFEDGADAGSNGGSDVGSDPNPDVGADVGKDADPVEAPKAKVAFVSPANGASVANPVKFTITASNVSTVQIEADEWPLAPAPWNPSTKTTLEYTFSGTGFERTVVLFGYDAQGKEVARDTIRMTVKAAAVQEPPPLGKGTSMGTFVNTYYYVEEETAHTGAATSTFYDRNCNVLAKVPASFATLACIEGTAKLKDGRVINYATNTQCGGPCKFTWATMDPARFPWGQGNRANALVPLISWAVDTSVIANGTVVYVEEWDGKMIPKIGTLGGKKHDGCFRADDVGGGIKGKHVDMFTGSIAMYRELNKTFPTRTSFTVYKNSPRCAHLK